MSLSPPPPFFPSSSSPHPPGTDTPATCEVPHFAPVRVGGARYQLRRLVRQRRRAVAVGLAVTAAALVAACPQDTDRARGHPDDGSPARTQSTTGEPVRKRPAARLVAAPVRIADGATVRLLRPGDRIDVIAAEETATGGDAQVIAHGALVRKVPEPADDAVDSGALVVLSVPRSTAARLVGASATARLAVTLC